MPSVAPSAIPLNSLTRRIPPGHSSPVQYSQYPPIELSNDRIQQTISDYCNAAKMAMKAGFDGVEVHAGNGYLPEQFLSSNINQRTDEYGGSLQKRCRFVIELMEDLAKTIGGENCAIRLSPFSLFNQTFGDERVETWSFLCERLKERIPELSYISLIEPVSFSFPSMPSCGFLMLTVFAAVRANTLLQRKRFCNPQLGLGSIND
jgi:2,4-dienoyl-CoA reductase-like NADH-dependent reductase (Old Yellow Enzyme family)